MIHRSTGSVPRNVRIEEEQRDPPHLRVPDLRRHGPAAQEELHQARLAARVDLEPQRELLGVGRAPPLVLPPRAIQPLVEEAPAIEQPHRHHRQPAVGGLLQHVSGEHAQPARVDGQGRVEAVLGAEEGHGPLRGEAADGLEGPDQLGLERAGERLDPAHQRGVLRQPGEAERTGVAEQLDRVVSRAFPVLGVDLLEDRRGLGMPGPPEVGGHGRQRLQRSGEPGAKRLLGVHRAGGERSHGRPLQPVSVRWQFYDVAGPLAEPPAAPAGPRPARRAPPRRPRRCARGPGPGPRRCGLPPRPDRRS